MIPQLHPGRTWTFDELPPNTIALDGACQGPRIDAAGRRFSFDHHAGCVRLCTTATCQQVLDALLLGLDPSGMRVLLNDIDGDTVLSVWLLEHARRWRDRALLDRVRPLVTTVGAGDCHGPAYPLSEPALAAHFHLLIMEPAQGWSPDIADTASAEEVLQRCIELLDGWWLDGLVPDPPELPELKEPKVHDHGSWILADGGDVKPDRRTAGCPWLYERGHDRVVLCSRLPSGRYRYTLAKRSDMVSGFPLPRLYEALNQVEQEGRGQALGPGQTWGGGSSVGGSPRDGSVLPPEEVARVVGAVIGGPGEVETPKSA